MKQLGLVTLVSALIQLAGFGLLGTLAKADHPTSHVGASSSHAFGHVFGQMMGQKAEQKAEMDELTAWCNDILRKLRSAMRDSVRARSRLQTADAVAALMAGLENAAASDVGWKTGPLTVRAVNRGIEIARKVSTAILGAKNHDMTMLHFLDAYYDFIQNVANHVDLPYFVPYLECGRCDGRNLVNNAVFEQRFFEYAVSQVELIINTMTRKYYEPTLPPPFDASTPPVVTAGPAGAFLTSLAYMASETALDLRETAGANSYACPILALEDLSAKISGGNYFNEIEATVTAYVDARDAVSALKSRACRPGAVMVPGMLPGFSQPAIAANPMRIRGSFSLNSDSPSVIIPLGEVKHITGISFNMEAYRHNASIDIFVDDKYISNPPIPAIDPHYSVSNISVVGSSIMIRIRSGSSVSIRNVEVFTSSY